MSRLLIELMEERKERKRGEKQRKSHGHFTFRVSGSTSEDTFLISDEIRQVERRRAKRDKEIFDEVFRRTSSRLQLLCTLPVPLNDQSSRVSTTENNVEWRQK